MSSVDLWCVTVNGPAKTAQASPFSYLIESQGVTYLVPGVNLKSVGTIRDVQKWPKRDRRAPEGRLDKVNFNLLSPYTIDKFLGNSLISRLETITDGDYLGGLRPTARAGLGDWVDLSGLLAPHSRVRAILDDVEAGRIASCAELDARMTDLQARYYDDEWTWAYDLMLRHYGLEEGRIGYLDLVTIIRRWRASVLKLDDMLYEDARKDALGTLWIDRLNALAAKDLQKQETHGKGRMT